MALLKCSSFSPASDDPLLRILRLEKDNFLQIHANLSIIERTRLWNERSKQLTSALDLDIPISSSVGTSHRINKYHRGASPSGQKNESQESALMSRKRPSQSGFEACSMKKSRSSGPSHPVQSSPGDITESLCRRYTDQGNDPQYASAIKVYSPEEYIREHLPITGIGSELQLTEHSHLTYPPSLSDSASILSLPLATPPSEEFHYMLPNSIEMSRQTSQLSNSFCDSVSMLALNSQMLAKLETPWDGPSQPLSSFSETPTRKFSSTNADRQSVTPITNPNDDSQNGELARPIPVMNSSALRPRAAQRQQEKASQASRRIAPKITKQEQHASGCLTPSAQTITYCSADGILKEARAIPKSSRERPMREGLKCTQCDEKPLGFHGQHELQRHIDNVHAVNRKAWICVDISPNKDFLSGCRKCVMQKRYGASYNAAEHLRRAHFHKKLRARQSTGKGSDQGAKDDCKSRTPSSELKRWMQEVTDFIPDNLPNSEIKRRNSTKALSYSNEFDVPPYGKEDFQQASHLGHRSSELSQSASANHPLANFNTLAEDSQRFSFIAFDGQSIPNAFEHTTFHATPNDSFSYSGFVDTESPSNFEPFVFDSDFPISHDIQPIDFPPSHPLPY